MKFSKKLAACITAIMMVCMMLTACGNGGTAVNNVVKAEDGIARGDIGTTFRTAFFDFSVDSVEYPAEYEGYTPNDGMQLLDFVITIKNTFGEELPMYNSDFELLWHDLGDGEDDYNFGVILDGSSTVMPDEYELAKGASCTYHVIFEAPAEAKEFTLAYLELFADDSEGDLFAVSLKK